MKKTKMIICLVLAISIGIIAAAPLLNAELFITPWRTRVQGPTAPPILEIVYADFIITDPDAPTNQIAPSHDRSGITLTAEGFNSPPTTARVDFNVVINVTNHSEYRTALGSLSFFAAQDVQEAERPLMELMKNPGSSMGGGITARGAWVDGVYYNVTCTIPWPSIDKNGSVIESTPTQGEHAMWSFRDAEGNTRTPENSTWEEYDNAKKAGFGKWEEGVQGYEYSIVNDEGIIDKYIYLNIDSKWVDVTGRVTFDKDPEPDREYFSSKGGFASQFADFSGSENRGRLIVEAGESRLIIISGSSDVQPGFAEISESYINPIDIIQSGTVKTLLQVSSIIYEELGIKASLEDNSYLDTHIIVGEIQELTLTQVGNRYIYNTVLSDNQTFQLDKNGFEVSIVPVK